ncbi:CYTH and CHAD domain-containing protein [Cellulomonas dongxiuzhuiae]|uniref:CYTH and CHAD domain-containing protein n=1 Tax=Cellulomonas dongxiuzhuiae TaxID=2819979 RepID=UPI001AAEEADB|nr:CYTH and CHAD domain-containing protein [Cellulomonas dongxiuzhuiae]MBO3089780.1 CYTH and CHAD domain-containing protein [Cellulomonas dongxiuzhuiae]
MPEVSREVEVTFSADDGDELPSLAALAGSPDDPVPLLSGEPERQVLRTTYVDTADLDLARHGITLRRRVGGEGGGWFLTVPGGAPGGSQVRRPPGRAGSAVPDELQRLVRARTGGRLLAPVARVTTGRTVHRVFDATDRVVLELTDDRVSARRILPVEGSGEAAGAQVTWREIAVVTPDADDERLTAVAGALRERGLTEGSRTSELARVLDVGTPAPRDGRRRPTGRKSSTSSVVVAYLADQLEQIRSQDLLVRLGAPGSVHKTRVATRRSRSALATFRAAFDPDVVTPLRAELKWLAGVLGEVRDAEVMRARVRDVLEAGSADATVPPAPAGVDVGSAHAVARTALLAALDGERYDRLLDALEELVDAPPTTERGDRRAGKQLRRGIAHEYDHVRRLMKRSRAAVEPERRGRLLHDARKAAKRTRYAAELAGDVLGADARAFAAAMESLQEALGEYQDTVVLRAHLRELAAGTTDPAAAFTYGRLHALEEVRAREAEGRVPAVWAEARRKRLRRRLR